jgi:hypothetical protein
MIDITNTITIAGAKHIGDPVQNGVLGIGFHPHPAHALNLEPATR